jgi:hypothetical protein
MRFIKNKIYFMHIPKTAGSAFNSIFKSAVPVGRYFEHMESHGERFAEIKDDGEPFYASGHFTFAATEGLIRRPDVFSMTILRNPVEQLISHLKWVKAYGNPEDEARRAGLPSDIAQLSQDLWKISLNDVERLRNTIDRPVARRLFDNLQVRYMTSMDDDQVDDDRVMGALENFINFDFIFVLEDMDKAIGYIRKKFHSISDIKIENKAMLNEDVNLQDRDVLTFYRLAVRHDAKLYTKVRSYSRERFFLHDCKPMVFGA